MPLADPPVPGRLCWSCVYMQFDEAPGVDPEHPIKFMGMFCQKGYWEYDQRDDLDTFRRMLTSAEQCAAFAPRIP